MLSTIHISHHLLQKVEDFENKLGISTYPIHRLDDLSDFDVDPWAKEYRLREPSNAQTEVLIIIVK